MLFASHNLNFLNLANYFNPWMISIILPLSKTYHFFSGPRGLQLQVFKAEVEQQRLIPTLRSFLKLYTSIPISKLAKFLDMHENEVRCCLMAFKHKKEVVSIRLNVRSYPLFPHYNLHWASQFEISRNCEARSLGQVYLISRVFLLRYC